MLRIARLVPKIEYDKLIRDAAVTHVSRIIIYRLLKEHGITNWIAKRRPLLTEAHAQARLQFALAHRSWVTEWEDVIFSDECSFERGSGGNTIWVFRTPKEKWLPRMIHPKPKSRDISQMIWGAVQYGRRWPLFIMERDPEAENNGYTAQSYLRILYEALTTQYRGGEDIFMHDNASIHTAHIVRNWLENNGIHTLEFPAISPDLNPIERVWAALKKKVLQLYPELHELGNSEEA